MDLGELSKIAIMNNYMAVFYVDPEQESCDGYIFSDILKALPQKGSFREHLRDFSDKIITAGDRALFCSFFSEDNVPVSGGSGRDDRKSILVRVYDAANGIHYVRVRAVSPDAGERKFVLTYEDETSLVEERLEETRALKLNHAGIQFVVQHMCEDFIIVNVETDESIMYTPDTGNMEIKASFREQINWFADNIVAPEERDTYCEFFKKENLVRHIRENNGFCTTNCTVVYKDGRHDFLIASALVTDPSDLKTEYLFTLAQDITALRKAQEKGTHDALTRLLNRSAAEIEIMQHIKTPGYSPGLLLVLDVDYFKQINDNYGHLAGDDVLRYLGDEMRRIFSNHAVLCRWGGDEFLIFVENRSEENKITELINTMKNYQYKGASIPVTLSIGVITVRNETDFRIMFQQADEAMYLAKENGRGCLVWG